MARFGALAVLALLLAVVVVGAPRTAEAAISCGQVISFLRPCIPYARGVMKQLPSTCCDGVKSLNGKAQTTPDRKAACTCLKSTVASIKGINMNLAGGVPGKCGVSIPYPISTTVDCSKVK